MNKMKNNRLLSFGLLIIFTGLAIYMCPCDVNAAPPNDDLIISVAVNHDCCDGMPNCPIKDRGQSGMNSFFENYSWSGKTPFAETSVPHASALNYDLIELPILKVNLPDNVRYHYDDYSVSPTSDPPLFLQFQSLLI